MSLLDPASNSSVATLSPVAPSERASSERAFKAAPKPFAKRAMQWTRRGHLFLGLFLFPWAVLYGITAFLFNHPQAFSDLPIISFDQSALAGTPLESLPKPEELALQVVTILNERQNSSTPYRLIHPEEARFSRELAFATVRAEGQSINAAIDLVHGGGTLRSTIDKPKAEVEKAPFAVAGAGPSAGGGAAGGRGGRGPRGGPPAGAGAVGAPAESSNGPVRLETPWQDLVKQSIPQVLENMGFPTGTVTVTSVPDLNFQIETEGKIWKAVFNPVSGAVSGKPADAPSETELSLRRFLLRLHVTHGYPSSIGAKWLWAIVVDLMAFTMVFWGVSGLFMWWQIKATRGSGAIILAISAVVSVALGYAMHVALTQ